MRELDQALRGYITDFATMLGKANSGRGFKYTSIYDLFLKEGFFGNPKGYTAAEEKYLLKVFKYIGKAPAQKACFYNAQSLALGESLGYAEGQVLHATLPVPIEHGFNTLPSGKVVDVTLRPMGEPNTCDPELLLARAKANQANAYVGLPIPASEIHKSWAKTHMSLMLIEQRDIVARIFEKGFPKEWKKGVSYSPVLSGPRPEEEWLNEPERENAPYDSTRSFEGDIPPWARQGYKGVFPLRKKVFYITAYVGSGPEQLKRSPVPAKSPVLGTAMPVQDVGRMPAGVQFGSEFMFYPLAAIPVRNEDLSQAGPVVDYLAKLIEELGAYGKILMEHSFPNPKATEVRLQNGRWFPVNMEAPLYGGITYLNAYSVNRLYGGPEEDGWWYDAGDPVASVPLREEDPVAVIEWDKYLTSKAGWTSKQNRGSVMGHDDFELYPEDQFAAPFPKEKPHYE